MWPTWCHISLLHLLQLSPASLPCRRSGSWRATSRLVQAVATVTMALLPVPLHVVSRARLLQAPPPCPSGHHHGAGVPLAATRGAGALLAAMTMVWRLLTATLKHWAVWVSATPLLLLVLLLPKKALHFRCMAFYNAMQARFTRSQP